MDGVGGRVRVLGWSKYRVYGVRQAGKRVDG